LIRSHAASVNHTLGSAELCVAIFEKNRPWLKKDGLHIAVPHFFVYNDFQNSSFVPSLQTWFDAQYLPNVIVKVDKIATKPWVVYGYQKHSENTPTGTYTVTDVYNDQLKSIYNGKIHNLSSLWSINKEPKTLHIFGNVVIKKKPVHLSQQEIDEVFYKLNTLRILDKLSPTRATDYDDWIDIGSKLYAISNGDERFLNQLWKPFSQRAPDKYKPGDCEKKWATFKPYKITLGSFFYYLKQDDKDEFDAIVKKFREDYLFNTLLDTTDLDSLAVTTLQHIDFAKVFYAKYKDEFVWSADAKEWFRFTGVLWKNITQTVVTNLFAEEIKHATKEALEQVKDDITVPSYTIDKELLKLGKTLDTTQRKLTLAKRRYDDLDSDILLQLDTQPLANIDAINKGIIVKYRELKEKVKQIEWEIENSRN
jgi:hypothetical protein